eukprot:CAMPEP_0170115900 /NCGR_PEP_ID=MMETSP0020_2-20130122/11851_1 /TAXON_ID=98059 /ORGANISM="Dinobryon sp., Strain UTEXLB2267" /LENGTH=558 /DNA_ID=CAMNT_0010343719 /DNA_START=58 /DNA_END=1734 /DNA_ORIENTATION=+
MSVPPIAPSANLKAEEGSHVAPTPSNKRGSCTIIENPLPQNAPGASAAVGHHLENSIPLSIFPIAADKLCICFCGLPGRGKTHISRRLGRYLSFFHAIPLQIYNVSEYRRRKYGALKDAEWFDSNNVEARKAREECNQTAIKDMITFLAGQPNGIAILDSTNPTHERRTNLLRVMNAARVKVMFIEVSNDNEEFLQDQYRTAASTSPDYEGINNTDAELDYRRKVDKFKTYFEPLDSGANSAVESKWSYIKCDHFIQHFVVHNIKGYLQQKVVHFIMNLRTTCHAFYLSRHGQSEYNDLGRIGGDSGLTQHGINYAKKLAEFVETNVVRDSNGNQVPARLWTSTMRRTKETAQFIQQNKILINGDEFDMGSGSHDNLDHKNIPSDTSSINKSTDSFDSKASESQPVIKFEWTQMRPRAWHHLDELFAGQCDGMTYEEIEERFPDEWVRRSVDKLAYRYPRGESYLDVIARLEPMIIEMERHHEPLLIIAHQGILRIIYAFYMGKSRAEAPYLSIPLNCVVELVPGPFDCKETRHVLYKPAKELAIDGQDEPKNDPPSH